MLAASEATQQQAARTAAKRETSLPAEVWSRIWAAPVLAARDVSACRQVCRSWKALVDADGLLWQAVLAHALERDGWGPAAARAFARARVRGASSRPAAPVAALVGAQRAVETAAPQRHVWDRRHRGGVRHLEAFQVDQTPYLATMGWEGRLKVWRAGALGNDPVAETEVRGYVADRFSIVDASELVSEPERRAHGGQCLVLCTGGRLNSPLRIVAFRLPLLETCAEVTRALRPALQAPELLATQATAVDAVETPTGTFGLLVTGPRLCRFYLADPYVGARRWTAAWYLGDSDVSVDQRGSVVASFGLGGLGIDAVLLATAGGSLFGHSLTKGEQLLTHALVAPGDAVECAQFAVVDDGAVVVVVGSDRGSLAVHRVSWANGRWDAQAIAQLRVSEKAISAVAYSPALHAVFSAGWDTRWRWHRLVDGGSLTADAFPGRLVPLAALEGPDGGDSPRRSFHFAPSSTLFHASAISSAAVVESSGCISVVAGHYNGAVSVWRWSLYHLVSSGETSLQESPQ